jgi:hypothetical protein
MKRLLVFALVASVGNATAAFAAESILTSGARHVQALTVGDTLSSPAPATSLPSGAAATVGTRPAASFQAEGNLSKSGMGKGKKMLIYIAVGVGFAASAWTIDHHVLNVTPSSLGTRQD